MTSGFTIDGPPRTKKTHNQIAYRGGVPFVFPSRQYRTWHRRAWSQAFVIKQKLRAEGLLLPLTSRANVKATFYRERNYAGDECGYQQALSDWLQDVGIIKNDRLIHWAGVTLEVDRAHPRIEVEILTAAADREEAA